MKRREAYMNMWDNNMNTFSTEPVDFTMVKYGDVNAYKPDRYKL